MRSCHNLQSERGGHTLGFVALISLIAIMGMPAVTSFGLRVADVGCDNAVELQYIDTGSGFSNQDPTKKFNIPDAIVHGYYSVESGHCCARVAVGAHPFEICDKQSSAGPGMGAP